MTSLARPRRLGQLTLLASPFMIVFLSSNIVNVGNLAYNMVFSRWMGPALFGDLAVIMTIKLAVLAILSAFQVAVSKDVAEHTAARYLMRIGRLSHVSLLAGTALLPLIVLALWGLDAGAALGLSHPNLLVLLALALPISVPLSLARGVVTGRIDSGRIVASGQAEMLVRLFGGVLAWQTGFGIEGVVFAIVLSIFAGWVVIAGVLPRRYIKPADLGRSVRGLAIAAFPFALLQAAQVFLLDGDVLVAKIFLAPDEAGMIAALSLFQRIEFFACFALASILLPSVTMAAARGENTLKASLPVAALFCAVSVPFMIGAVLVPETLITWMVGPAFLDAAPLLWKAAATAVAFTFSFLLTTWLVALKDRRGIMLITLCVPVQIGAFVVTGLSADGVSLSMIIGVKLVCQVLLAMLVLGCAVHAARRASAVNTASAQA